VGYNRASTRAELLDDGGGHGRADAKSRLVIWGVVVGPATPAKFKPRAHSGLVLRVQRVWMSSVRFYAPGPSHEDHRLGYSLYSFFLDLLYSWYIPNLSERRASWRPGRWGFAPQQCARHLRSTERGEKPWRASQARVQTPGPESPSTTYDISPRKRKGVRASFKSLFGLKPNV